MKVLTVNKFYYRKGGSEAYFFGLNELLQEHGIEVIPFSMHDKKNLYTKYEKYFVSNIDYSHMNTVEKIKNSAKIVYSHEAKVKMDKILEDEKPDIAHLHIFQHQLSPSILHSLKQHNVKVVNTVHDLKVICPNYKMLNNNDICEDCKGDKFINCFKNSCVKGSKSKSLVSVIEAYVNRWIKSYSYVDKFICPSQFYRDKFIEFGVPKEKVIYIPNFVDVKKFEPKYIGNDYILYIGRLSEEKGIKFLIETMKMLPEIALKIVGTGPIEEDLKLYAIENNINNVEFLGFKTGEELKDVIRNCRFIVIPSLWYENCPMTIIEAMAYGKSCIGSKIGGIPELIEHGESGLVYESTNKDELAEKIKFLYLNQSITKAMGKRARDIAEKKFDKEVHYKNIKAVYDELLK